MNNAWHTYTERKADSTHWVLEVEYKNGKIETIDGHYKCRQQAEAHGTWLQAGMPDLIKKYRAVPLE